MKHTGTQTRIGVVVPKLSSIRPTVTLSKEAKQRLKWIDYYHNNGNNGVLTCRHFGIHHKTFYRYYNRFKAGGLVGLESRSSRPHQVRKPLTPRPVVELVKRLRRANPEYSKYKLEVILRRDYGYSLSASTIGRIISRHNLFFTPLVKPKGHPHRRTSLARLRKPKDFVAELPGKLVEVDLKHLPNMGVKRYGFVAIDVVSRTATVHVATTASSRQAAIAWRKTVESLGLPKAALGDNGSENLGAFAQLLAQQGVTQYFARPKTPKDKPYVERFIGTLERECIQWGGVATNTADQQALIDAWLHKYHDYRPHQSLGYLTPNEYRAKLKAEVALM